MPLVYSKYAQTKKYDTPLYPYPSSVQEIWPVKMIDESGIFGLNDNRYSKLFKLTDINFAGVTDAEQKNIIINFSRVLNSMNCRFSYTVANEYVDEKEFNEETLYTKHGTDLDGLSDAFNEVIFPFIGIFTNISVFSFTNLLIPKPSLPTIIQIGPVKS